jgi:hypothetical protein
MGNIFIEAPVQNQDQDPRRSVRIYEPELSLVAGRDANLIIPNGDDKQRRRREWQDHQIYHA